AIWITKKKLPYDTKSAAQDSLVTAQYSDILSNILTVKTFASEKREQVTFQSAVGAEGTARLRAWNFNNILIAALTFLYALLEMTAMGVVLYLWTKGEVSTGTVVLVQIYVGALFYELFGLGRAFGKFMKSLADAREMVEI